MWGKFTLPSSQPLAQIDELVALSTCCPEREVLQNWDRAPFVRLLLCTALWKSPSVLPLKVQRDCAIKEGAYVCVDHIPL